MKNIIKEIENKIVIINNQMIMIDSDVAVLYKVETKRVNEAVKNNPDKFPGDYIINLSEVEWVSLRSNISTIEKQGRGQHTKYIPKAFTEKGLYMLATILKSPVATQTTIAIIETFSKIRELGRNVERLSQEHDEESKKPMLQKSSN